MNKVYRNLTVHVNLADEGEQEALLAEITELVEKYGFKEKCSMGDSEGDEVTFIPG